MMKKFLIKKLLLLIRKYGVVLVLQTLAQLLKDSKKDNEKKLGEKIEKAVDEFKSGASVLDTVKEIVADGETISKFRTAVSEIYSATLLPDSLHLPQEKRWGIKLGKRKVECLGDVPVPVQLEDTWQGVNELTYQQALNWLETNKNHQCWNFYMAPMDIEKPKEQWGIKCLGQANGVVDIHTNKWCEKMSSKEHLIFATKEEAEKERKNYWYNGVWLYEVQLYVNETATCPIKVVLSPVLWGIKMGQPIFENWIKETSKPFDRHNLIGTWHAYPSYSSKEEAEKHLPNTLGNYNNNLWTFYVASNAEIKEAPATELWGVKIVKCDIAPQNVGTWVNDGRCDNDHIFDDKTRAEERLAHMSKLFPLPHTLYEVQAYSPQKWGVKIVKDLPSQQGQERWLQLSIDSQKWTHDKSKAEEQAKLYNNQFHDLHYEVQPYTD